MNPMSSMTSTRQERIAYLQEKGPHVSLFDDNREVSVVLLRDGKEEHHTFFRNTVVIVFPQSRSYYPIPDDAPDYFMYAPRVETKDEIIPLNKDEADIIAFKIYELNSALEAEEAAASEADKECGYCGENLGDCYGDHEEDDDRASITSVEIRINARILAMEATAKMNNEVQQEKQAFQNEWSSGRQRILAIHEARMAADADKQLKERMRVQATILEEYGSEEAFLKARAAGDEAMRLILASKV
jgi:hypothetical protein